MEIMDIYVVAFGVFFIGIFLWYSISKSKEQKRLLTKLIEFSVSENSISVKELLLGFSHSSKHNLIEVFECCDDFNEALLTDEVKINLYYNDIENLQLALRFKKPIGKISVVNKEGD